MGGWYLLVFSCSFNQLKIKFLLIYLVTYLLPDNVCVSKGRNIFFSENFVHVLNESSSFIFWAHEVKVL